MRKRNDDLNIEYTYRYLVSEDILYRFEDQYELSLEEHHILFEFFVTYADWSKCFKRKNLNKDYGWDYKSLESKFYKCLNLNVVFYKPLDNKSVREFYESNDLIIAENIDFERVCITNKKGENEINTLLLCIRHALCHSLYRLAFSNSNEKLFIFQTKSENNRNVASRGVIKLSTLLKIVSIIKRQDGCPTIK